MEAKQSESDADLLICQAAMVIYGDHTDLLVLLCHYAKENRQGFFTFDKQTSMKNRRVWDISEAK